MPATLRLHEIAHTRSGDKGNHANVAVLGYTAAGYEFLKQHLTPELVGLFFRALEPTKVERFLAPNVLGLNFLLYNALAGGASRSLHIDAQGKSLGQAILELELPAPADATPLRRHP